MEYLVVISLILSVLSFSAAVWMKVSERKWKKAMLDCIQQECKSSCDIALNHSNETAKALTERMEDIALNHSNETAKALTERMEDIAAKLRDANIGMEKNAKLIQEIQGKLQDLSLDYSQAQKAADQINDYANGLMNLFNYDPMDDLKRKRESGDA